MQKKKKVKIIGVLQYVGKITVWYLFKWKCYSWKLKSSYMMDVSEGIGKQNQFYGSEMILPILAPVYSF